MWANTCWGFLGLFATFATAGLAMMSTDHAEWGPRLLVVAAICLVASIACFFWPLFRRQRHQIPPEPNTPIADAVNYIVNDSIAELKKPKPAEIAQYGPAKGRLVNYQGIAHQDALNRVQSACNNGQLDVWGHREFVPGTINFEQWLRPIPKTYWDSACFELLNCNHVSTSIPQTMPLPGKSVERYTGLTLNRCQIELLWRASPWWRRKLADFHVIRRQDYWGRPINRHYRPIERESNI